MQTGNLDKAEEYAKKFVAKREKIPEGYNQLGQIYVAKGEWTHEFTNLTEDVSIVITVKDNPKVSVEVYYNDEITTDEDIKQIKEYLTDIIRYCYSVADEYNIKISDISESCSHKEVIKEAYN